MEKVSIHVKLERWYLQSAHCVKEQPVVILEVAQIIHLPEKKEKKIRYYRPKLNDCETTS